MIRVEPAPHQESVWDYPRPPKLVSSGRQVKVLFAGEVIAESTRCYRVLETSHPPSWYIPAEDVRTKRLSPSENRSFCEFKGHASYWSINVDGKRSVDACWSYQNPTAMFASIKDYFSFYANRVDECSVDGEIVQPQAGDFYGGWITPEIVGPFKGGRGTWGW